VYLIIASRRRLRKRAGFHLGFLGLLWSYCSWLVYGYFCPYLPIDKSYDLKNLILGPNLDSAIEAWSYILA
jgi:hypothetical protein